MTARRQCAGPCGKNRDVRFFGADSRRKDGLSTVCVTCRKRKRSTGTRNQRLQDTYGITEDEYAKLVVAQGGVCGLCGGVRSYNYDIDHDHKTGLIRGALCKVCNRRLLPSVRDSIERLERAIEYLRNPPAIAVLGYREVPR